ncbi:Pycsar system effector family protein [Streptoverticillium reticulum]|uniref:Pycsar system effector family protein n=1 Tax=Streptoverticillium reticulum TaxID=1433415 RepID=UPI0039BEF376
MSSTPEEHQGETGLDRALKSVVEPLNKTDVKAWGLFATDVGLAALVRGALTGGPTAARVTAGVAAGFLAVGIVFITLAALPRLEDHGTSFLHWASLTPEEIQDAVREDVRPQQVRILARLAKAKFRLLQVACVAIGLAGMLLLASDILAATG